MRTILAVLLTALLLAPGDAPAASGSDTLQATIDGPQRGPANRPRDRYRHPAETLAFLGLAPGQTVVEITPGGGYWTEILAPYLKEHGHYIAALGTGTSAEARETNAAFAAKLAADPAAYGGVEVRQFGGDAYEIAPPGGADLVLTFRNLHNWMHAGTAEAAFRAFFKALKPGGMLGIEDHRGRTDQPQDPQARTGYVRQDAAVALAEAAGFKLAGSSEANANPLDTKDWPAGVWTLPPTLRLKDQDRAKYEAIGESDRFLLKFVKP